MKKFWLLLPLLATLAFAEGPKFRHKDPITQREFQNVYQDIQAVLVSSGTSSRCIDAPTLCVDVAADRVRISSSTSAQIVTPLRISNPTNTQDSGIALELVTGASENLKYRISSRNSSSAADPIYELSVDNAAGAYSTVFKSFQNGEISQPLQPSFLATAPANTANVTGDGTSFTVEFDTEIYDQGADYNAGTYIFTAPVTGRYLLSGHVLLTNLAGTHTTRSMDIITSNRTYGCITNDASTVGVMPLDFSVVADMDANDTARVTVTVSGGAKTVEIFDAADYSAFSASMIN
jgi:hypothetical protein